MTYFQEDEQHMPTVANVENRERVMRKSSVLCAQDSLGHLSSVLPLCSIPPAYLLYSRHLPDVTRCEMILFACLFNLFKF